MDNRTVTSPGYPEYVSSARFIFLGKPAILFVNIIEITKIEY